MGKRGRNLIEREIGSLDYLPSSEILFQITIASKDVSAKVGAEVVQ